MQGDMLLLLLLPATFELLLTLSKKKQIERAIRDDFR